MLSGFNTNYRYRGVLFHVQTEDSGLANPHVITHLFHGGNIMASVKRDYSELVAATSGEALEDEVRQLMQGLHKTMLKELSRGEHDAAIEERMGPEVFRADSSEAKPEPPSVTEEERPPPPSDTGLSDVSRASATRPEREPVAADASTPPDESAASPERTAPDAQGLSRVFGERVVSEKPLDEVVLDYLVENARRRKRPSR